MPQLYFDFLKVIKKPIAIYLCRIVAKCGVSSGVSPSSTMLSRYWTKGILTVQQKDAPALRILVNRSEAVNSLKNTTHRSLNALVK
jgi:hypothetical protein